MFHCPVGFWVIEQHAIILSATVRSPTVPIDFQRGHFQNGRLVAILDFLVSRL